MIKFIDLFSGIGGFRIALENLDCKCVFSSEIDIYARETYKNNFGEYPSGDIFDIDAMDIPNHDILCAGFPCQPFSLAGKRLGFEDVRGTLFFEIARIIKAKRPKIFLLENVSGIVSHDNGKTLKIIINNLNKLEYNVSWKLLNAKHYGIPQNRNRWYCVGVDRKFRDIDLDDVFPKKCHLKYTLKDILSVNCNKEHQISKIANDNIQKHIDSYIKKNQSAFVNGQPIIANNIRRSKVSFSSNGISPCLTAKMGTGGNNVPVIVNLNRKFTTEECLKIMGFPSKFVIKSNYGQSYKQIGNSVVVPIIEIIAKNLIKLIF